MYALIKELWPAPIMQNYAKKLIKNEFNGKEGFTLDGGIKDCSHIRKLAEQHNVPVPVVDSTSSFSSSLLDLCWICVGFELKG
jgi:3-hydroxyisobutyrate dehydrogenase-like beta-hydroxyacid dehydrogenase